MFIFPGDEKNERDAGADRAVGNIERWKTDIVGTAPLQVKINEVHDGVPAGQQPVGQIPGDAAEDESERNLTGQCMRIEVMPGEKQGDERKNGDKRKRVIVAAEKTPGRAGIAPMNEFKKTGNNDFFIAGFKRAQHEPFGELVERQNEKRQRGDATVRFIKNGSGGHGKFAENHLITFCLKDNAFSFPSQS